MRRVAPFVLALALAGCGDDGLSPAARERLGDRIADAREAAGSDDAPGARRALLGFRREVRAARERGEISRADADRLLRGALQATRRVAAEITPEPTSIPAVIPSPTPVPTAVAPSAPVPPPAPAPAGEGKGKGKAKGKGKKKP